MYAIGRLLACLTLLEQLCKWRRAFRGVLLPDDGASRNSDLDVGSIGPMPSGAAAPRSLTSPEVQLLPEGRQRVQACIHCRPDVATVATIPSCWTPCNGSVHFLLVVYLLLGCHSAESGCCRTAVVFRSPVHLETFGGYHAKFTTK